MSTWIATLLVNATWQIPVLAALAFVLTRFCSFSAAERHRMWGIALLLCWITPVLTSVDLSTPPPSTSAGAARPILRSTSPELPSRNVTVAMTSQAKSALGFLYVAFIAFGFLRLARSLYRIQVLRRDASPAALPHSLRLVEARCRCALGAHDGRLLVSSSVSSPVTCGFFDPVIVVPTDLLRNESREMWTAILGHELAHIRRRDYAWHIAFEALMLFVGVHPVTRWIKKHVDRTREEACDEIVARELVAPRRYARSLVDAATLFNRPNSGYSLGVLGAHSLEERIVALIGLETHRRNPATRLLAFVAAASFVSSGLALSSFSVALASPAVETREPRETGVGGVVAELPAADDSSERESYRAAGRRDPFLGPQSRPTEGPEAVWGFDVDTVSLHGIVKTPAGFTAMLVGPDEKTYFVREGQRFYNGTLSSIGEGAVVIRLQDTDPLSTLSRDIELRLHQP